MMNASTLMSRRVVSVQSDDRLSVVKDIFDHTGFHHLLVLENDDLIGVISDRDLYHYLSPYLGTMIETDRDVAALGKRAHQIMQRNPAVVGLRASIHDILQKFFNDREVTCVIVLDEATLPVGIITWRDLLRLLQSLLPAK
jgi:acetoin utilization protein AcuB